MLRSVLFNTLLSFASFGPTTVMANDTPFSPGQNWKYNTRPGEEQSTLTILKIEPDQNPKIKSIVHIAVHGVRIVGRDGNVQSELPHMPISELALRTSVKEMVGSTPVTLPEGYSLWKSAFDSGKAGTFSIPVSECVATVETGLQKGSGH